MSMTVRNLAKGETDRKKLLKKRPVKVYDDGRTKQAFKDQCDINKILKKAQQVGSLSHLNKYPEQVYGEFDGEFDLLTAHERIGKANEIFDALPSEIRREFGGDALKFVKFAGDPANNDKLRELLPQIAEPGTFFPNPVQRGGTGAGAATAPNAGAASTGDAPPIPPAAPADPPAPAGDSA